MTDAPLPGTPAPRCRDRLSASPATARLAISLYERLSGRRPWSEAARLGELQWQPAEVVETFSMQRLQATGGARRGSRATLPGSVSRCRARTERRASARRPGAAADQQQGGPARRLSRRRRGRQPAGVAARRAAHRRFDRSAFRLLRRSRNARPAPCHVPAVPPMGRRRRARRAAARRQRGALSEPPVGAGAPAAPPAAR